MATITTRSGKGSPLTNTEVDANFTNLNTDKVETSALDQSVLSGATPNFGVGNMTLDDSNFVVANTTNLQTFADNVDGALRRARGTGVSVTYVSTVAVGGTTFAQPAVTGEITSDQGYFEVSYAGATGITVANLSAANTYVYIDKDGALQQQITTPTREDWSRKIFTMRIAVAGSVILGFEYLNNPIGHYANSVRDLYAYLLAQGIPFKKDQTVTGRAADLGFDISAGSLMEFGGTGDINNPNIKDFSAVTNAGFFLTTRTAFDAGGNTALPKFWDNNGVLTALGSTTLVGHRLYRFSNGNLCLQYGQGNYANMTLAKAGAVLEDYVINPALKNATFFGWWFIESTATNTGGTTLTSFVEYTVGVQGGSSSGLSGALLKGNNLSDLLDAATSRNNLGLGTGDSPTFAAATVTGAATMDGLTVGTTSDAYSAVYIISATTGESELRMGDTDTDAGSISYTNSDDTMTFRAAAGARMTLDSTGIDVAGVITVSGTVDGRDVATDGTKLDTIATNANNYSLPFTNNSTNWNTAYGWGNHASAGYDVLTATATLSGLKTFTNAAGIKYSGAAASPLWLDRSGTNVNIRLSSSSGTTYVGQGLSSGTLRVGTTADLQGSGNEVWHYGTLTTTNKSNYDTAYGWGNHASQSYATQSYVATEISNLVDSSPAALDTLNELAAALGDDPNFATTVTNSIATKLPLAGGTLTGDLLINSANAEVNLRSGAAGTSGAVNWTFNTNGTNYASINLPYDTRASTGLHIDSGYPITIDASSSTGIKFVVNTANKATINGNGLTVSGTVTATGGNSTNWNAAFGWGNHASESYATESYVATEISNLVDSSPAALDTLNELAAALGDDPNFATTVTNSIATKLPLAGGTLTGDLHFGSGASLYVASASSTGRIPAPGGAMFTNTSGGTQTGAFKIKLPVATSNNSSMISFEVVIFDYASDESVQLRVSGYAYGSGVNWTNHTVTILSATEGKDYTVRFGSDGTSNCLWIGELTSTWAHSKVGVFNLMVGHSADLSEFASGWEITQVTSFDTVQDTVTGNLPYAKVLADAVGASQLNVSGDGTTSQYLRSDADGSMSWVTPPDTIYTLPFTDNSTNWNTSYGWGNHASAGYLTSAFIDDKGSYTSDLNNLTAPSHEGYYSWSSTQPTNSPGWNYGGIFVLRDNSQNLQLAIGGSGSGNQRLALRRADNGSFSGNDWTEFHSTADFSSADVSSWNTAYGWGNHASAGYVTTNTTYSAGTGITLSGTTFSLTDTNAKLNLSGGTISGAPSDTNGVLTVSNTHSGGGVYYPAARFINTYANHTFGVVAEFRTNSAAGTDRPSILFTTDLSSHTWQVGTGTSGTTVDDFVIGYRGTSNDPNTFSLWNTPFLTLNHTTGNATFAGTISSGVITATGGNSTNWNTAYGWGNHASAGYVTTNTTYSAGTGISLSGTTFSLTDTNAKLNLSGGTLTGNLSSNSVISTTGYISSTTFYTQGNFHILNAAQNGYHTAISRGTGDNFTLNALGGYQISGTTVIDSSRNLTNIGTITASGNAQVGGALKITESGTAQVLMMGNQDSGGTNKPAMIMGVNGALRLGFGNSWTGEGGSFTEIIKVDSNTNISSGVLRMGGTTVIDSSRNITAGTISSGNISAPIFYDSDNADYYVDPNSNSNLHNVSVNTLGIDNTSTTSKEGISLYGGSGNATDPSFGFMFTGTAGSGTHGTVTGNWATYFTMDTQANRGWIFRAGTGNVASVSNTGHATFDKVAVVDKMVVGSTGFRSDTDDVNRPQFQLRGGQYPSMVIDSTMTGGNANSNHGPTLTFVSETDSGFRRFGIGTGNNNASTLDFGWYDNQVNPHYGVGTLGSVLQVHKDNYTLSIGSFRAPVFYDRDNTSYYLNPNDDNISLRAFGDLVVDGNYGRGLVGKYSSTRLQHVFSMGTSYRLPADGTSAGNLYGLAWSHPNAGTIGGANNLTDHGLLVIRNGDFRSAISDSGVFSNYVKGQEFYDYDNSGYYLDPAGTSVLNAINAQTVGVTNIVTNKVVKFNGTVFDDSNITDTGSAITLGTTTTINGNALIAGTVVVGSGLDASYITMYDNNNTTRSIHCNSNLVGFLTSSSAWGSYCANNGDWHSETALRAPIFYDANNAGYYLDPASTSNLNILTTAGDITAGGRAYIQGSTTNFLGQGPYSATNLAINMAGALFFYSGTTNIANFSTTSSFFMNQIVADKSAATTDTASATIISRGTVTTTTGYQPQNYHITFQNGGNVTKGSISSSHYATIYTTSSDYRLKEDLQPISYATERVLALNPVNFKWIDGQQRSDGFIAHELQAHLPEAVTGEKDATTEVTETVIAEDGTETEVTTTVPEMQGIDQSKLVPLLVKTIQELEARITALENA